MSPVLSPSVGTMVTDRVGCQIPPHLPSFFSAPTRSPRLSRPLTSTESTLSLASSFDLSTGSRWWVITTGTGSGGAGNSIVGSGHLNSLSFLSRSFR